MGYAFKVGAAFVLVAVALQGTVRADEEGIEVLFSSGNQSGQARLADRICEILGGAETSIDIAVAHLNYERIAQAIVDRAKAVPDLSIRVLLDYSEYGAYQRSQGPLLEKAGIPVRYKFYTLAYHHFKANLMHHKFMVVDGKWLVAGSYNWSETAEKSNDENILVFRAESHSGELAAFRKEFDKIWPMGRRTYPAFKNAIIEGDGPRYLPVHFNTRYFSTPMSLTRDEIEPILSAARRSGLYDIEKPETFNYYDRKEKKGLMELPFRGTFLGSDRDK